jgi:hypothetical protein
VANAGAKARAVRKGIGGISFWGSNAPAGLKQQIAKLVARAGNRVPPFIASDEEGGAVQRLAGAIYPLRSAEVMGTWSENEITRTATKYGKEMKDLGVDMAMSPVADLNVPGNFIGDMSRAFSSSPNGAARSAIAWATGLEAAGVVPVVKHWPGHGRATDTHTAPGIIPPFEELLKSDLVPFDRAIADIVSGNLEQAGTVGLGTDQYGLTIRAGFGKNRSVWRNYRIEMFLASLHDDGIRSKMVPGFETTRQQLADGIASLPNFGPALSQPLSYLMQVLGLGLSILQNAGLKLEELDHRIPARYIGAAIAQAK